MIRALKFILLMIACVAPLLAGEERKDSLVWPSPPDRARIRYERTIASVADLDIQPGFFSRVFGFLFGAEQSQTWLVQPVGIAVSGGGLLAIADPGAHGIHVIDRKEKEYRFIGETKFGRFVSPVGVAFGRDGSLYVSDSETGKVIMFNTDLEAQLLFVSSIRRPTGLAVKGDTLYVVDTGRHKVVYFDLKGKLLGEFGARGAGEGEFNFPVQSAVSGDDIYVVDALNYRVVRMDRNGKPRSSFGALGNVAGKFAAPKGIATDSDGDVYVTDALMDNIQIFNRDGQLLLVVGHKGTSAGEFMSPGGIAIDGDNTIYVVDTLNKRLQLFKYLP